MLGLDLQVFSHKDLSVPLLINYLNINELLILMA